MSLKKKVMYALGAQVSSQRVRACWCAKISALVFSGFAVVEKGNGIQRAEESQRPSG